MKHERSVIPLWKLALYVLAVAGLVASILWVREALDAEDGRPPVVVSNGSVVIEDMGGSSSIGQAGAFQKSTSSPSGRAVWVHMHDGKPPKQFTATVTDSSCGATFYFSNIKRAVFTYTAGTATREIYARVAGPFWSRALEFDVDAASSQTLPAPERLVVDQPDGRLVSVRFEFNGAGAPRTCGLSEAESAKVTIHQTQ